MYDCEKTGMTYKWDDNNAFLVWLAAEQSAKSIELVVSQIEYSDLPEWQEQCVFRCSREFTGGKLNYKKKHQCEWKISSKKTGCLLRLGGPSAKVCLGGGSLDHLMEAKH